MYVRLNDLNDLLGTAGRGTEAAVLLTGANELPAAFAFLQRQLPGLVVEDWRAISPETALVMSALDATSFIIISYLTI